MHRFVKTASFFFSLMDPTFPSFHLCLQEPEDCLDMAREKALSALLRRWKD